MSEPVIPERCRHCGAEVRNQGAGKYVHLTQAAWELCGKVAEVEGPPVLIAERNDFREKLYLAEAKVAEQAEEIRRLRKIEIDYQQAVRAVVKSTHDFVEQAATIERLTAKLNSPELVSFRDGVILEASHQRERWGSAHDDGKQPSDWFWLVGYLGGKALAAHVAGNLEKALHHTISTAAALANWHAAILGKTDMRPGIMEPSDAALSKQK